MKRALCIWLPNWPVQRIVVARPELKFRPVVLHERDSRRGQLVCHCSSAAYQLSIHPPMPVAEAEALLPRANCQPTLLDEHNPQADREELEQLAIRCEQFSSLVGLENDPQPSAILLDIAGTAGLLGGESKLADRIVCAFRNCGYLVRVGIADTLGAAWAVAHFAKQRRAQQQPSLSIPHIEIVPPTEQVAALAQLPIEALRLNAETVRLLSQLGVAHVEQLLQLPRGGLRARFGDALLKRLDQASGQADEVIHTYRPTAALEVFFSLEHATDRQETIEQLLHQLITELSFRLQEQHRGVIQLESELTSTERRSIVIHVGLFRPTADVQHLFDLVRMQLERKTLTAPIQAATVRATLTSRLADKQRAILNELSPHVSEQLAHLVERLSSRLGRDRVVTTRLLAEPQPERNYRYESLAGQTARHSAGTPTAIAKNAASAGLRPLRLYPEPIPLRTIELAAPPTRTWTIYPAAFQHRGQTHHVTHSWGPERIETGWWRGPTIRRDYFQVEDEQGCRYWIFRDLERRKWFLHGFFE